MSTALRRPALVKEAALRLIEQFPQSGARTLARTLHAQDPKLFPTLNGALLAVRRLLGQNGALNRSQAVAHVQRAPRKAGDWHGIPRGKREIEWIPHDIPVPCRALVLSDLHVPFHDRAAVVAALKHGLERKCNVVFFNGDLVDCYATSRWETDPKLRDFKKELDATRALLTEVRAHFPKARIVWKMGNHEERYGLYMQRQAPVFLGVPEFDFGALFQVEKFGIELVRDMRPVRLGKLNVLHGHEYRFAISNPVNPARGLFLRARVHALCGHFHQSSQHSEGDLESRTTSSWSTGCLCDLHPRYMPLNKWNLGFAIVEVDAKGAFIVRNYRIVGGKVYA